MQSTVSLSSLPSSYRSHTSRERALLESSEHFRRQFVQLYPAHTPLQLAPLNECGVRKFLCTSVKPLLLPFTDLYDLPSAAAFISDFLAYLPLDDRHSLPDYLPSLTSIVACRAGDCLDMAVLLCSLLRGSGYTALVVQGRAERWVCDGDQSRVRCPLLRDEAVEKRKRDEDDARKVAEERAKNPYLALVPQRPSHTSAFQKHRQQHATNPLPSPPTPATQPPPPSAHCWVLVMPGRRDVSSPLYVEPSTGASWEVRGPHPYRGVDVAFNDVNCWVNVQGSGSEGTGIALDFDRREHWLEVVMTARGKAGRRGSGQGREDEEERAEEEEKEALSPAKHVLHLPASWVAPVSISRDLWQARYPSGHKRTRFLHCTVDRWSPHLAGHKGLVLRIEERGEDEEVVRVEERFEHRRDRLQSRVTDRRDTTVTCAFEQGLPTGLREYRVVAGVRREFHFWKGSRVDGLVRRVEEVERKVVEEYESRDDRLTYRSISVDPSGQSVQQRQKAFAITISDRADLPIRKLTEKYSPDPTQHPETDVVKRTHLLLDGLIVLRYACADGRLEGSEWVIDKNDKLESSEAGVSGGKEGVGVGVGVGGVSGSRGRLERRTRGWVEMGRGEEQVLMGRLLIVEKELKVKVKERESRMSDMVRALDAMEDGVELVEDVYDAAYHAALNAQQAHGTRDDDDDPDPSSSSPQADYLSPFLLAFPSASPLSRRQAEQVKAACLTALKERLLSRAAIIQAHLEDEQAKLQTRQSAFKRAAGGGSVEANEEFAAFSEGCLFRIDILLARRARHEQMAVRKYAEMEAALSADPRLQPAHDDQTARNA